MARYTSIDDPDDPRLAAYVSLRDPALRRGEDLPGPHGHGVFIAEGKLVVPRLLASSYPTLSVLITPERRADMSPLLDPHDVEVYITPQEIINQTTGYALHRGVLACGGRTDPLVAGDLLREARRVAVVEGMNDQENLGSLVRSARALGIDALLLDPMCCDPLYRRVVRVSMGHVLYQPFARLEPWPDALGLLSDRGFALYALTPSADAEPMRSVPVRDHDRIALAFGAEGPGLTPAVIAASDRRVRIEQRGDVDSLNVGHAAAIAFSYFGAFHV